MNGATSVRFLLADERRRNGQRDCIRVRVLTPDPRVARVHSPRAGGPAVPARASITSRRLTVGFFFRVHGTSGLSVVGQSTIWFN